MVITDKYFQIEGVIYSNNTKLPYRTELGKMVNSKKFKSYCNSITYADNSMKIHQVICSIIKELESELRAKTREIELKGININSISNTRTTRTYEVLVEQTRTLNINNLFNYCCEGNYGGTIKLLPSKENKTCFEVCVHLD